MKENITKQQKNL